MVQDQVHVLRLVDQCNVSRVLRVNPCLAQRRVQLVLAAAAPDRRAPSAELAEVGDPRAFPRDLSGRAALEDLGDVRQVHSLLARRKQAGQPVNAEFSVPCRHLRLGRDFGAARKNVDVQPGLPVVAECLRRVVAGKLRLDDPLQLQADMVSMLSCLSRGRGHGPARAAADQDGEQQE